jgi:CheY-like chemotaxis protein/HPt (histidine-containing phosphotransfer) domain-containing protein
LVKVIGANADELAQRDELEFRDEATQHIADMNRLLDEIAAQGPQEELLESFRRHGHELQGAGRSFGYPVLTMIAHRLGTYLDDMSDWQARTQADLQAFVDKLGEMLERRNQPADEEIASIVRALPSMINQSFSEKDVEIRNVEILLVTPTRAIAKLLAQQIKACGFRVTSVADPVEGLTMALRLRPDMVLTSQVMKGLNGVDLLRALKAIEGTEKIPGAVLTSQELDAAAFNRLPDGTKIIRAGSNFADDFAKVVTQYGLG